jgi:hypothetical protein
MFGEVIAVAQKERFERLLERFDGGRIHHPMGGEAPGLQPRRRECGGRGQERGDYGSRSQVPTSRSSSSAVVSLVSGVIVA